MKNHRKMITVLLWLDQLFWRLATLTELSLLTLGQGLKSLIFGRRGQRLLSHREIYAKNIVSHWADFNRGWLGRGLYIRRFGRLNSHRHIRVGQG